jgi:malonate transporter
MMSAFSGFALIAGIVLVGWVVRRSGGLPEHAEADLGRISYLVLAPCLLFGGVAAADLGLLFSEPLLVSTAAAVLCFAIFAVTFRRRDTPTRVLGAMAGGYTNAATSASRWPPTCSATPPWWCRSSCCSCWSSCRWR